jgi:hypothetical protein
MQRIARLLPMGVVVALALALGSTRWAGAASSHPSTANVRAVRPLIALNRRTFARTGPSPNSAPVRLVSARTALTRSPTVLAGDSRSDGTCGRPLASRRASDASERIDRLGTRERRLDHVDEMGDRRPPFAAPGRHAWSESKLFDHEERPERAVADHHHRRRSQRHPCRAHDAAPPRTRHQPHRPARTPR